MEDPAEDDFIAFVRKQTILRDSHFRQEQHDLLNLFIDEVMSSGSRVIEQWKQEFSVTKPEQLALFTKLYKEDLLNGIIKLRASLCSVTKENEDVNRFKRLVIVEETESDFSKVDVYISHNDREHPYYEKENDDIADPKVGRTYQDYRLLIALKMECDEANYRSLSYGRGQYRLIDWRPIYKDY